ncbi:hypothetical protein KI387_042786, partial [Taxus chinensis]
DGDNFNGIRVIVTFSEEARWEVLMAELGIFGCSRFKFSGTERIGVGRPFDFPLMAKQH